MITGPPDTPYTGGQYHGTLTFPADYPFKPPAIRMFTPSGRFRPGMRLCLSISDYHPKTWNPAWSVSTILTGLLSFMVGDESTAGSIESSEATKIEFAKQSKAFNLRNYMFVQHFPDLVEENKKDIIEAAVKAVPVKTNSHTRIEQPSTANQRFANDAATRPDIGTELAAEVAKPDIVNNAGMSRGQKFICLAFLFVSWLVASKLFASHL